MNYLNLHKQIAALAVTALLFSACKKVETATPMGDAGQTLVKIIGGGTPSTLAKNPVDFVNIPKTLLVADVRRDAHSNASLNTVMHVTIKDDNAAALAKNPAYVILPSAWYTIDPSTPRVGGSGGTYTLTFNPGEFAKPIWITIPNATLLDPSTLYALGFTITAVDGDGVISTQKSVVVEIGAKNKYDGVYHVTGTLQDVSTVAGANLFQPWLPFWEALAVTTGASSVDVYDNTYTGLVAHPFWSAPNTNTYFGSFGLQVFFNNATNAITEIRNWWGVIGNAAGASGPPNYEASNTRRAVLDPTGVNMFNPGTHDIDIKYFMLQSSVMGSLTPRVFFNEHWAYVGPR